MRKARFVNLNRQFAIGRKSFLQDSTDFIRDSLTSMGIARKNVVRTELLAEETIVQLIHHAEEDLFW